MARTPAVQELVTPEELARLVGRSTSTLAKWRMRGIGPPFLKVGPQRVVYDLASYRAWLAARERRSTAESRAS